MSHHPEISLKYQQLDQYLQYCIALCRFERTTLHYAANEGHKEVMKLLVLNRADVNGADNMGRIPVELTNTSIEPHCRLRL
jgi:ankyrin repeat protein